MYSIYSDGVCIYNDSFVSDNLKVISPKLILEDSAAGSLTFTLPPTNIAYSTIVRIVSDISVRKNNEEIWAGRVLSEEKDFLNNRTLYCEGELAFLNDSTQPPAEYHNQTVRGFLETLINIHNSKVGNNRKFSVGTVTVTDPNDSLYRYTNYEKTIECINEKLLNRLGGHIRVRKVNGVRYLDYLKDYPIVNSQTIEFGKNLLDFTRKWESIDFATVIVPLGNRLEQSSIEALDSYLTVSSVNNGSIYVKSPTAISSHGWIEKVVRWDNVTTASALLTKAQVYLSDVQFDNLKIELSALDMNYLNVEHESVKLLDKIRVISRPHGMDRYFPVTKLEIPLDSPDATQFKLGDNVRTSLTNVNNAINAKILQKIEDLPKAKTILKEAKENATQIMNMATNGYITITKDAYGSDTLYVSNNRNYTQASKLWKWNLNGLGYSKDGGQTYGLAITMDGAIVADYITTGTLKADIIKTGVLKDINSNTVFNLDTGSLMMRKGSININNGKFVVDENGRLSAFVGIIRDISSNTVFNLDDGSLTIRKGYINLNNNFTVDTNGYLTSIHGKIGGFNIGTDRIWNNILSLENRGLSIRENNVELGYVGYSKNNVDSSVRGFVVNLGRDGDFTGFTAQDRFFPSDDIYYYKLVYVSRAGSTGHFSEDSVMFFCDIDGRNYLSRNFWLDPTSSGCNGGITGKVNLYNDGSDCYLEFKHGMLVGARWYAY